MGRLFPWRARRHQMSCAAVLEILQSYVDGETDAADARRVALHLERCGLCDGEAAVYRRIKMSLSRQRAVVDPSVLEALTRFGERVARGENA
ncbi:MAG: anti-sigma factor family protein [Acidimicrobiales bacterium]